MITKIEKTYRNGTVRTFNVIEASYANEESDAIFLQTQESGAVIVTKDDEPDFFAAIVQKMVNIIKFEEVSNNV